MLDMTLENRRQYVAAMLGCKPTDRSERLNEMVDGLLKGADRAASDWLQQEIMRRLPNRPQGAPR